MFLFLFLCNMGRNWCNEFYILFAFGFFSFYHFNLNDFFFYSKIFIFGLIIMTPASLHSSDSSFHSLEFYVTWIRVGLAYKTQINSFLIFHLLSKLSQKNFPSFNLYVIFNKHFLNNIFTRFAPLPTKS